MPLMMGDWLMGTRGMNAQTKGVYIGLLIYQYDNGFIPSSLDELKLIEPEVGFVWVLLKTKFSHEVSPGKLQNLKLEEVRNFWNKQKNNGQKGGRPSKKNNPNHNPDKNPNNNLKINPNHNHHIYDLDLDIKNKKGVPSENEFLDFCKTITKNFIEYEFSFKAKYESWVDNGWKDGNDKAIKNWKTKIKNTFPHLKPLKDGNPKQTQSDYSKRKDELSNFRAAIHGLSGHEDT